jgi:hypothetical protein
VLVTRRVRRSQRHEMNSDDPLMKLLEAEGKSSVVLTGVGAASAKIRNGADEKWNEGVEISFFLVVGNRNTEEEENR